MILNKMVIAIFYNPKKEKLETKYYSSFFTDLDVGDDNGRYHTLLYKSVKKKPFNIKQELRKK